MQNGFGITRAVTDEQRQSLYQRFLPLLLSGPLPNYPSRLAGGGFDDYRLAYSAYLAGAINFVNTELQPALGKMISEELPFLSADTADLQRGAVAFLHIGGLAEEAVVPPTPFRGIRPMREVATLDHAFFIDLILLGALALCSQKSGFVQSNVDPLSDTLISPPLRFHIDRGAEITALGTLRGSPEKYTCLSPWSAIAESCTQTHLEVLRQRRFISRRDAGCGRIAILCNDIGGDFQLSDDIIRTSMEISDIGYIEGDFDAKRSLDALLEAIEQENLSLEQSERPEAANDKTHWSYALHAGDLLLINNRLVLHGRSCGRGLSHEGNRWLRVAFGERRSKLRTDPYPDHDLAHLAEGIIRWRSHLWSFEPQ